MVGSKLQTWCICGRMPSIMMDLLGVKPLMQSRLIKTIYVQAQAEDALPVETSPLGIGEWWVASSKLGVSLGECPV
jgi:hypothetical protein